MSDYLTNLAARSINRAPAVQPRLALLFEPPQANASEPSSQETTPAATHGATHSTDGATHAIDSTTVHDATFSSGASSSSSRDSSSPDFSSHAFPSHTFPSHATPPSVEDERHDARGAKWSPTASTHASQTFQEGRFSSSVGHVGAEHDDAEHDNARQGRSSAHGGSLNPEPSQSGLLIPPPSSPQLARPPGSLEGGAMHDSESHASELQSSDLQSSELHASEGTQKTRGSAPASADETRGALASQPPMATNVRGRLHPSLGRLNDEAGSSVTGSIRPARQRATGALDSGTFDSDALDSGAIDSDAKGAAVQFIEARLDDASPGARQRGEARRLGEFVEQTVEDTARRVVAERLGGHGGAPRRSPTSAEQTAEKVLQSLLVPAPHGTGGQSDGSSSSVTRGAEHAATAEAIRVRARLQTPAHARSDAASKPESAPTINVSIGRIEVRAVAPPAPPQPRPAPARPAPKMSLDDYLRAHNGGRK